VKARDTSARTPGFKGFPTSGVPSQHVAVLGRDLGDLALAVTAMRVPSGDHAKAKSRSESSSTMT
jgi:hypothetical protein